MPQAGVRIPENAPGKFYVTGECDGCGICFSYALQNFMYSNDSSYYYVYQQPEDEREEADIRRAMDVCPQSCIRDDGESVPS
ncbi:MAG: ferredoxin [Bacteroidota bacterium]